MDNKHPLKSKYISAASFVGIMKEYRWIVLCILLLLLFGCSQLDERSGASPYLDEYEMAVNLMIDGEYDTAEERLLLLIEELESIKQANSIIELKADAHYALGQLKIYVGQYGDSYDHYNDAFVYYRDVLGDENVKTVDARFQLASVEYSHMGRLEHALGEVVDIYEHCEIPRIKNLALCYIAAVYRGLDDGDNARKYLDEIQSFIQAIPVEEVATIKVIVDEKRNNEERQRMKECGRIMEYHQYLSAYAVIGDYYLDLDGPEAAIEMYNTALNFIDNAGLEEEEKIEFYEGLGFIYLYYYGDTRGKEYLDEAISIVDKKFHGGIEKTELYINIAEYYLALGDYDKFGQLMQKTISMIEHTAGKNHPRIAGCKVLQSQYFRGIGKYQEAIKCCEDAIEIDKNNLVDTDSIGAHYNNLANCYVEGGNQKKAIDAYLESIEVYEESNNMLQIAVASRNIALVYNNSFGEHELALQYAHKAISIVDEMDTTYFNGTIAAIYMLMADILTSKDDEYQLVEYYSDKAIERLQASAKNVDEEMAYYHFNLGVYLSDNRRYKEALTHLKSAETLYVKVYRDIKLYPTDIYHEMAICLYGTGFYDEAMGFFEKSISYCQSHTTLLYEEHNYGTSYWDSNLQTAKNYCDTIKQIQEDTKPNMYGGRFLREYDEIVFDGEDNESIFFYIEWYRLASTGRIEGKKEGNIIVFDYEDDWGGVYSGIITIKDDMAILDMKESNVPGVELGVQQYGFFSDEVLAKNAKDQLCGEAELCEWSRLYNEPWQSKTDLIFNKDGTVSICVTVNDGDVIERRIQYEMLSEKRVLIDEIEYSMSIDHNGLYLSPIHSDELQLMGSYMQNES